MALSKTVWAGLVLFGVAGASGPARAGDPNSTYEALFGQEARKVARSAGTRDDAAFAAKLLSGARAVPDAPGLQQLLLAKAYEFGFKHRDGYLAAVDAMELLGETYPQRRGEALGNILAVRQRQYRYAARAQRVTYGRALIDALLAVARLRMTAWQAGEALRLYRDAARTAAKLRLRPEIERIRKLVEIAKAQEAGEREMAALARLLKARPGDRDAAKKLLMGYLIHRNDPNTALGLLEKTGPDEVLRTYVPLAAKGLHEVPGPACLELGDWYSTLLKGASVAARGPLLRRMLGYYERSCDLHGQQDTTFIRMQLRIAGIAKELKVSRAGTTVDIAGDSQEGYDIGPVKPNTRITLSYVSGTWRSWSKEKQEEAKTDEEKATWAPQSPDDPDAKRVDRCRLVLVACEDEKQAGTVLAVVRTGTAAKPFTFLVSRAIPKLILRIQDKDGDYEENTGEVHYRLSVVRYF